MALLTAVPWPYGMFSSNCWAITQTLAGPLAAGKWTAHAELPGQSAGIAAPWITGSDRTETGQFFLRVRGVAGSGWRSVACACLFVVGDAAPIAWGWRRTARGVSSTPRLTHVVRRCRLRGHKGTVGNMWVKVALVLFVSCLSSVAQGFGRREAMRPWFAGKVSEAELGVRSEGSAASEIWVVTAM